MNIYRNLSKRCKGLVKCFNRVNKNEHMKTYIKDCNFGDVAISVDNEVELSEELVMYLATRRKKKFIYFLTDKNPKLPLPVDSEEGIGYDFNVAFTNIPELISGDDVICIVDGSVNFTKEQIDSVQTSKIFMFASNTDYSDYLNRGILSGTWYNFLAEYCSEKDNVAKFVSDVNLDILQKLSDNI